MVDEKHRLISCNLSTFFSNSSCLDGTLKTVKNVNLDLSLT